MQPDKFTYYDNKKSAFQYILLYLSEKTPTEESALTGYLNFVKT